MGIICCASLCDIIYICFFCLFFLVFCLFFMWFFCLYCLDLLVFDFCGFLFCRFCLLYLFFCLFLMFRFCFLFFSLFCFLFLLFDSFSDFFFVGNDFLTRLLSDWFFFVYVLVKDFPLLGFFVCVFDCFFSDCRLVLDFLFFVFFFGFLRF